MAGANVVLLADLFHMNIEEADLAAALLAGAGHIGHVHFVDSNRRPAGCGHLDYAPIAAAMQADRLPGLSVGRGPGVARQPASRPANHRRHFANTFAP